MELLGRKCIVAYLLLSIIWNCEIITMDCVHMIMIEHCSKLIKLLARDIIWIVIHMDLCCIIQARSTRFTRFTRLTVASLGNH